MGYCAFVLHFRDGSQHPYVTGNFIDFLEYPEGQCAADVIGVEPHAGDSTGGSQRPHTGGNLFFLQLRATGMEVDLPLIAYDWGPDQPAGGVEPDVRVPAADALGEAERLAREGRR